MKLFEIILTPLQRVIFYPFSGADFEFIKSVPDNLETHNTTYIFCSVATNEDFQILDNQTALFNSIDFMENAMGLAGLSVSEKYELDEKFNATFYKFKSGEKLVFVKENAFEFIEQLIDLNIPLWLFNLVLKGCGSFEQQVIPIIEKIYNPLNPSFQFIIAHDNFAVVTENYIKQTNNPYKAFQLKETLSTENNLYIFKSNDFIYNDDFWIKVK